MCVCALLISAVSLAAASAKKEGGYDRSADCAVIKKIKKNKSNGNKKNSEIELRQKKSEIKNQL